MDPRFKNPVLFIDGGFSPEVMNPHYNKTTLSKMNEGSIRGSHECYTSFHDRVL